MTAGSGRCKKIIYVKDVKKKKKSAQSWEPGMRGLSINASDH
jgi:hypothetical protein